MPVEWSVAGAATAAILATYLIHSTLLLGGAWLLLRLGRARSAALRERVWKTAALAAVITAPMQVALDVDTPAWTIRLPNSESATPAAEHDAGATSDLASSLLTNRHTEPTRPSTALHHRESPRRSTSALAGPQPQHEAHASPAKRTRDLHAHDHTGTAPVADGAPPATTLAAAASLEREPRSTSASTFVGSLRTLVSRGLARDALLVVGALFAIGGLVRLLGQGASFRRRLTGAQTIRAGRARAVLDELLHRARIRWPVRLLSLPSYREPVTFGLLRPAIVLPRDFESRLSDDELRALLAHELAHVVRGDAVWLWIGRLLCSSLALQPLNFVARREWQRAAEERCDDWAVENAVNAFSLARCLTFVAEWRLQMRPCSEALAAGGPRSTLIERVERLVARHRGTDPWTLGRRRSALALAPVLLIGALVYWGPRVALVANDAGLHAISEVAEKRDDSPTKETRRDRRTRATPAKRHENDLDAARDTLGEELELLEREIDALRRELNDTDTPAKRAVLRRIDERWRTLRDARWALDSRLQLDKPPARR